MQETAALAEVEKKGAETPSGSDRHSSLSQYYEDGAKKRTHPKQTQGSSSLLEKEQLDKRTLKVTQPEKKRKEYGKVHTRHVNQLFIRGENVLLVNIQQD